MRLRQIIGAAAASAISLAMSGPVTAGPMFPWLDTGFPSSTPPAANSGWTTKVIPENVIAARDPLWSATVAARASAVITGSIGTVKATSRKSENPQHLGPRLTGVNHALAGNASYYWEDQTTATGEHFDRRALTAAHKTLPFGTRVRVTCDDTGKSVIVRINDRGPYKEGRVIDLSERAAESLGMTSVGIAAVRLEVLGEAAGQ